MFDGFAVGIPKVRAEPHPSCALCSAYDLAGDDEKRAIRSHLDRIELDGYELREFEAGEFVRGPRRLSVPVGGARTRAET